jgi:hypothetical protein
MTLLPGRGEHGGGLAYGPHGGYGPDGFRFTGARREPVLRAARKYRTVC